MKKFTTLFIIISACISLFAQRMPERMIIFNPLFDDNKNTADGAVWINSVSGWAEFGGYIFEDDNIHAWYQKLGAFAEIFRISDSRSLVVLSNIEFIADPHNDINFNPRAIYWEEAFLYTQRTANNFWQAGYYHRCKHDIDNFSYGYERSLIYGSIMSRYIHNLFTGATDVYFSVRTDFYTILQDYRDSENAAEQSADLTDASFSISGNLNIKHNLTGIFGIYFNGFTQLTLSSKKEGFFKKIITVSDVNPSFGAETGIYLSRNGMINLGIRYEYFTDSGIELNPSIANLISLGIGFYPGEIF